MISRLSESLAYENRFVVVFFDDVSFPGGAPGRHTRIRSASGFPGVVLLPFRSGCVGLVRQYRYPVGRSMWELPRGGAESADVELEARRELAEETGASEASLVSLGVVHPDSGILESEVHLFLAHLAPSTPFAALDEVDDVLWVPVGQLLEMIADGDVTDAFTIAAVTRAHLRGHLVPAQRTP